MKNSRSTSRKFWGNILGYAIVALIYFGMDRLTPALKESPIFNGLMSLAGIVILLALPLLARGDQRPFAPGDWFPLVIEIFGGTSIGLGMVFYGLSFWFHGLEVVAFVLMGLFVISGAVFDILLLRADKKRSIPGHADFGGPRTSRMIK